MGLPTRLSNIATATREWLKVNRVKVISALVIVLLLAFIGVNSYAADITYSWSHPTQYSDNTALPVSDISQTRIEYGTCSNGSFGTKSGETVVTGTATSKIFTLSPGTWCARAFTTAKGAESIASNVAQKIIVQPAPKPPTLSVVDVVAYDVRFEWRRFAFVLNREVGQVPLGTACLKDFQLSGGYYRVATKAVSVIKRPASSVLVARCA